MNAIASALAIDDYSLEPLFASLGRDVRSVLAASQSIYPPGVGNEQWCSIARSLPDARKDQPVYDRVRRAADIVLACLLLLPAGILVAVLAILVWREDRGPAFYRHQRVTVGGRQFGCLKLRTMHPDSAASIRPASPGWRQFVKDDFKIRDSLDTRITRVGRFLRATYLDELPQLWNVLKGDMALVGPRPIVPAELLWYGPFSSELLSVRPGLTGAWQLTNGLEYPQRAWLELAYVRSRSPVLDLRILIKTLQTIVTGAEHPIGELAPSAMNVGVSTNAMRRRSRSIPSWFPSSIAGRNRRSRALEPTDVESV
jgi:lipopolysaccharide/colanic/teichoic acid biosynthesis glycosyltransferase